MLADIKNGVSELNAPAASTPTDFKGDGDSDVDPDNMLGCTITIRTKDSKIEDVNISQFGAEYRDKFKRSRQLVRNRIGACITFISKNVSSTPDLGLALGNTAAGRYTGPLRVAVIYDTKLHGEATHKPSIRLPPFQGDDVKVMLEAARDRFRTPHSDGILPAAAGTSQVG